MRVAIVGSRPPKAPPIIGPITRQWYEYLSRMEAVKAYVRSLPKGTIVVSGGAEGVDKHAEIEAKRCGLYVHIYYPRWDIHGKGAGFARNRQIVANSDRVVAFYDGVSRGTAHTMSVAVEMGKELVVFP